MDSNFVSIIIPTYCPGQYIYDCLDSLAKQTLSYASFEIIIVLNGCKAPYEESLKKYIRDNMRDMDISVVQTDRAGVSNARNMALSIAKGNYICFLDDDDYISTNYLVRLLEKVRPGVLVVSNLLTFSDEDKNKFGSDYITYAYQNVKSSSVFACRSFLSSSCAKLIHKDIIDNKLFDVQLANSEDALFMFNISNKIDTIERADADAIYYRRLRKNSASRVHISLKKRFISSLRLVGKFSKIYVQHPFSYNLPLYISRIVAVLYRNVLQKR